MNLPSSARFRPIREAAVVLLLAVLVLFGKDAPIDMRARWEQAVARREGLAKGGDELECLIGIASRLSSTTLDGEIARVRAADLSRRHVEYNGTDRDFEYDCLVWELEIVRQTCAGDRSTSVERITLYCPRMIGSFSTDYFLATSRLSDGMMVLFEAYERCNDDRNKGHIAACVQSAFGYGDVLYLQRTPAEGEIIRSEYPDDASHVKACGSWYFKNRDRLKINHDGYWMLTRKITPEEEGNTLFIQRDGTEGEDYFTVSPSPVLIRKTRTYGFPVHDAPTNSP